MTKRVLIPARRMERKGKTVQWVSEVYLEIFTRNGIVPIIVPVAKSTIHILDEYLHNYDGLLLVEGGDVHPERYATEWNEYDFEELDRVKDEIEFRCFTHAYLHRKPILGICRGMHIINVALGGTLHTDIHKHLARNYKGKRKNLHIDYENYDTLRHKITINPLTPLMQWYEKKTLAVNSYHHQAIEKLGECLIEMACDNNGMIEAIYVPHYPFLVGLQFHPERMWREYKGNERVFMSFIEEIALQVDVCDVEKL